MALNSPGAEVNVVDESFYTPAEPGTVPLIVVASAENKLNGAGDGIAPGTLKANAGKVYLISGQKDLTDTFGDPRFITDASGNPVHASEQNEYGLQAAYSFLGVSGRAFIARADVDLNELTASATAPAARPNNGTYWLDTDNTKWGIFEWNNDTKTFVNKVPMVITDSSKVDPETGGPNADIGKIGAYAVVTVTASITPLLTAQHPMTFWYKADRWVKLGSTEWSDSGVGTLSFVVSPHTIVPQWKTTSAPTGSVWIKTTDVNLGARWRTSRYNGVTQAFDAVSAPVYENALEALHKLDRTGGGVNIPVGTLYVDYNTSATDGVSFNVRRRRAAAPTIIRTNKITESTFQVTTGSTGVLAGLSPVMGKGITAGTMETTITSGAGGTATVKVTTSSSLDVTIEIVSSSGLFRIGESVIIQGSAIGGTDQVDDVTNVTVTSVQKTYRFKMSESVTGSSALAKKVSPIKAASWSANVATITAPAHGLAPGDVTVISGVTPIQYNGSFTVISATADSFTYALPAISLVDGTGGQVDDTYVSFTVSVPGVNNARTISKAINDSGFRSILSEVDSQNRLVITHNNGGEIHFTDGTNSPLAALGFAEYDPATGAGMVNLYAAENNTFVASLWEPLTYVAAGDPPTSLTVDGTKWYSSSIEADILVHNGTNWAGYLNEFPDTDALGPFITATAPETQRDGSTLETGDIWIDTSDIEQFPVIHKYSKELKKWILVDNTDQSTEDGIIFADARYNTTGANSATEGSIEELLTSDFVDFDAPDPTLYPQGMLLWNLRRSGFNVKEFRHNYVNVTADNERVNGESMADYYPHRWVTISSNQDNGAGSFGRHAQRKVVVKALQGLVNSSQELRDEERRVFNLIACPGYPELIGELTNLNYDRGITAFVVGDTPARLKPDATSLLEWGTNAQLAVEDNDIGAPSYDEYLGMFYPWGYTSDNFGNNIVVPPSHMILRTIALSDQVSYPWFAPAGLRRGGITNATSVGYVDSQEGEFKTVALNNGQRDTLQACKINPITFFTGSGLVNYGQKTRAKAASALDRINVARLVIYLRSQLSKLVKPYIFEPNDRTTRNELKGAIEALLLELVGQRALYDYLVVCDESNNTPSRIDRNELWVDIAIEPVKAVEFIYIPLRLKNTGEISGIG